MTGTCRRTPTAISDAGKDILLEEVMPNLRLKRYVTVNQRKEKRE